jgi:hypothetical protein
MAKSFTGLGLEITKQVSGAIEEAFAGKDEASTLSKMETAATDAMRVAGDALKTQGRESIRGGGFGIKWQNAWRVNVYPKTGRSLDPAAYGYHKIPYAVVFEEGATIRAKAGLLWIPLPNVPKKGQRKATPRGLIQSGIKLFSLKAPGKKPLLAAKLRGTPGQFRGKTAISLAKLRKGAAGKRGSLQTVPLFFGVQSVTEKKRFDLVGVTQSIGARVGDLYDKLLKE